MRVVSWFSCGAASAVATKLALAQGPVTIANCEVIEEHPDNEKGSATRWRPQLHELPNDIIAMDNAPDIQCGIFCEMAKQEYEA